jgi:hypothetical protein
MQQTNQPTRIPNRLLIPNDRLLGPLPCILNPIFIFFKAELFISFRDREDEEEGEGGARNEREKGRIVDRENVMEGEGGGESESVC